MSDASSLLFKHRFRGFLPVVVDLETGGFNASTDGILEIAATFFELDDTGQLSVSHTVARNVDPCSTIIYPCSFTGRSLTRTWISSIERQNLSSGPWRL